MNFICHHLASHLEMKLILMWNYWQIWNDLKYFSIIYHSFENVYNSGDKTITKFNQTWWRIVWWYGPWLVRTSVGWLPTWFGRLETVWFQFWFIKKLKWNQFWFLELGTRIGLKTKSSSGTGTGTWNRGLMGN